jgi:hypothetical protein
MNAKFAKPGRILLALLACYGLSACSVEPWVKPYERDRLADPIMALDGDPVSTGTYTRLERARGAAKALPVAAAGATRGLTGEFPTALRLPGLPARAARERAGWRVAG